MIEKILLADSGSGNTQAMVKALMEIPAIQRSQVTVLHVVKPQAGAEKMAKSWAEGGEKLASAISTLELDPSKVNAVLREGDPKSVVCKVADETNTDLIVMGSRGLQGLQAILGNSVSQYVFQLSSHPMLLVKDDLYSIRAIRRILVAIDKSDSAKANLDVAITLARDIKDSELIFVHSLSNLRKNVQDTISERPETDPVLAPAIAEAKKYGVKYRCLAPEGKPGARLCELAADLNVHLMILGSPDRRPTIAKGMPDLDRLLGESLSDYVRVYAPCPVLLTRISN